MSNNMPIRKIIKYVEEQKSVSISTVTEFIKNNWTHKPTQSQQIYRVKKCPLFSFKKDKIIYKGEVTA